MAARKAVLRRSALAARAALAPEAREAAALGAASHALNLLWATTGVIALYVAVRGEMDAGPLAGFLAEEGRRLALPVTPPDGQPLAFRAWTPGGTLVRGRFGIPEPGPDAEALVPDVLVVPCVAFDVAHHRLGYGAGFYDRTIGALRARAGTGGGPLTMGLAFACQGVGAVPHEPHDVPLDAIVSEAGLGLPRPVAQVVRTTGRAV